MQLLIALFLTIFFIMNLVITKNKKEGVYLNEKIIIFILLVISINND